MKDISRKNDEVWWEIFFTWGFIIVLGHSWCLPGSSLTVFKKYCLWFLIFRDHYFWHVSRGNEKLWSKIFFITGLHSRPRTFMGRFRAFLTVFMNDWSYNPNLVVMGFGPKMIKLRWNSARHYSRSQLWISGSTMSFTILSGGNLVDGLLPPFSFVPNNEFTILFLRFHWVGKYILAIIIFGRYIIWVVKLFIF